MKGSIVIVEDEILVGMMLKKKIEEHGYQVMDIVTTGEGAINAAAEQLPDLMLMDVGLPGGMDGITAAKKIKQNRDVPIIFFTGNRWDDEIEIRSREVNPAAILDKMGSFSDVIKAVKQALVI